MRKSCSFWNVRDAALKHNFYLKSNVLCFRFESQFFTFCYAHLQGVCHRPCKLQQFDGNKSNSKVFGVTPSLILILAGDRQQLVKRYTFFPSKRRLTGGCWQVSRPVWLRPIGCTGLWCRVVDLHRIDTRVCQFMNELLMKSSSV